MPLILNGGTIVTMNSQREVLCGDDLLLDGRSIVRIALTGSIIKASCPSLLPLDSIADQWVRAENGASVESLFVDGKPVMLGGRIRTIDENSVRAEVSSLQPRIHAARAAVTAPSL